MSFTNPQEQKRKDAARKAVDTLRYRLIEDASYPALMQIHAEIQKAENDFENSFDRLSFIAKNIGKTTWKSFTRYGDRNRATPGLILYWISNTGLPLDERAMYLSDKYGQEITPDELAEFMMDFDRGCHLYEPVARIIELKQLFKETAGFNYDFRWINKHLLNPDPSEQDLEPMPF